MARVKRVPQRTCIGCGTSDAKRALIRVVRTPEGAVIVDPTGKRNGRGAYVCSLDCFDRAAGGRLEHALKVSIPRETVAALREDVARLAGAPTGAKTDG
ncbi:MAG: YlxR family protein [Clostridia bacterium]|nr:YlxR family protein [Clostridia bacterium]